VNTVNPNISGYSASGVLGFAPLTPTYGPAINVSFFPPTFFLATGFLAGTFFAGGFLATTFFFRHGLS